MSRPRTPRTRDLPANLYAKRKADNTYYEYRRPDTGATTSLGKDKRAAIQAARILNNRLAEAEETVSILVAKVEGRRETLSTFISHFRDDVLPAKRNKRGAALSDRTLGDYGRMLTVVDAALGHHILGSITRLEISKFLNTCKPTSRNRYRSLLHSVCEHVVAEGYRDDNPVAGTLRAVEIVERRRLTKADVQAIREQAKKDAPWFVPTLDLAVVTLQRREDLVNIEYPADGSLYVVQQKTGAHLKIPLTESIEQIIATSKDSIVSPYIVHRRHERTRAAKNRSHPTQLTPDQLTRTFADLRDAAGVAKDADAAQRPTFHELRAYGAREYEKRGFNPQALLGHLDAKTTRTYLDRHKIEWAEVVADLPL